MDPDRIELDLPAHTRHASMARAVAAALGADAGFSIDDIDDLRLGIDEAISVVCHRTTGARLHISFERADSTIQAIVAVFNDGQPNDRHPVVGDSQLDPLAERILGAVVDSFTFTGGVFTIVKSSTSPASATA